MLYSCCYSQRDLMINNFFFIRTLRTMCNVYFRQIYKTVIFNIGEFGTRICIVINHNIISQRSE